MKSDLNVDAGAARACASAVAGTGARVAAGATHVPPPVLVPRWATSDAAGALTGAAHHRLASISAGLTAASHLIRVAADDYLAADDRAAQRLRSVR
jgi:hypothetical protein